MQKILYIITQQEFGGAQQYVFDLATNLDKSQYDIHIATGERSNTLSERLQDQNLAMHKLKNLVRTISPFRDLAAYFELRSLIKKINPDIVHLNSSKVGVLGSRAAKKLNIRKIIYTVHGFVFNEPMNPLKRWIYKQAELGNAKHVHTIITVSEHDKRLGIRAGIDERKLVTIHNGIDATALNFLPKEEARAELNITTTKPVVGCIANFYSTKGLDILISAMNTISAQLIIIGDGSLRPQLEIQIKKLNLSNRVTLAGQLPNAHQYLKAFDLFVLASRKEGFPYVLLEAATAKIPIVATSVGGIPEIINNSNGFLANPESPKELAQKINLGLSRPLTPTLSNDYTINTMLKKTIKLYHS